MSDITLIILSAGKSTRFAHEIKKQWLRIDNAPLWKFVTDRINKMHSFHQTVITCDADDLLLYPKLTSHTVVPGSNTRQKSLLNAIEKVITPYVLVTDVARACVSEEMLRRILDQKGSADSIVPYLPVVDTVVYEEKTIDRDKVKLIQTPQLSRTEILKKALQSDIEYTDESSAIKALGGSVSFVLGDNEAKKITYRDDLFLSCLKAPKNITLSGNGFDVHAFEENKTMKLCGITIDVPYGLKAHSDGDVAVHALIDALLGAAGYGDIGEFFPDTDERYKNADSIKLLEAVVDTLKRTGFEIINVDITLAAQKPRLTPYKQKMTTRLKEVLSIPYVNVKATTTEKLGFIGRSEGIAVFANANIKQKDWNEYTHR